MYFVGDELNRKLYQANQLDAIFDHHESVSFTFTYPEDHTRDGYIWENAAPMIRYCRKTRMF